MRLRTKAYKNKKTSKRVYKTKFSFNESPSKSIKKTFTKEETKDYTGEKNYQKRAISLYQKSLSIDIRRDTMLMPEFDFSFINKLKDISNKFEVSKSIFENICATVEYKKDIIAVLAKGLCEIYIKDSAYHKLKSIDISNENFENNSDSVNNDEVTDKYSFNFYPKKLEKHSSNAIKNRPDYLVKCASLSSIKLDVNNYTNMDDEEES